MYLFVNDEYKSSGPFESYDWVLHTFGISKPLQSAFKCGTTFCTLSETGEKLCYAILMFENKQERYISKYKASKDQWTNLKFHQELVLNKKIKVKLDDYECDSITIYMNRSDPKSEWYVLLLTEGKLLYWKNNELKYNVVIREMFNCHIIFYAVLLILILLIITCTVVSGALLYKSLQRQRGAVPMETRTTSAKKSTLDKSHKG